MRDDFSKAIKQVLAERVAWRCSNPGCRNVTVGPHLEPSKRVNLGQACHIEAAAEGGPRYNRDMTKAQRCSPDNGIWLCSIHAREIDVDAVRFPVSLLREWKLAAEQNALEELGKARDKEHPDVYTENINRHREFFSHIRDMEYFQLYKNISQQCFVLRGAGLFNIIVKDRFIDIDFNKEFYSNQLYRDCHYIDLINLPVKDLIDFVVCSRQFNETIESFSLTYDFRPNEYNEIYFSFHVSTVNINPNEFGVSYYSNYIVNDDELRNDMGVRVPPSCESIYLKILVASYNIYRSIVTYQSN